MAEFILALWIITALFGGYLWSYTTSAGRPESNARATALPSSLLFIHPGLALSGLVIWFIYLFTDEGYLAWTAFVTLLLVALIGDVLLVRTLKGRGEPTIEHAVGPAPEDRRRAEDRIPLLWMAVHGVLAVSLIALVLVEAIMAGW